MLREVSLIVTVAALSHVASEWCYRFFLQRLKHRHVETWNVLGQPRPWTLEMRFEDSAPSHGKRYFRSRRFKELGDPQLNRLAEAAHVLRVVSVASLCLLAGLVAYRIWR